MGKGVVWVLRTRREWGCLHTLSAVRLELNPSSIALPSFSSPNPAYLCNECLATEHS